MKTCLNPIFSSFLVGILRQLIPDDPVALIAMFVGTWQTFAACKRRPKHLDSVGACCANRSPSV